MKHNFHGNVDMTCSAEPGLTDGIVVLFRVHMALHRS